MKLRYTPAAIADMQDIRDYIRDVLLNPEAVQNILAGIAASCAKLKEQPYIGLELRKKLRREIEGRCLLHGRYIICYEIDEAISILRVLDTRTDYVRALFGEGNGQG